MSTCLVRKGLPHWFVHLPHAGGTSVTRWLHASGEKPGLQRNTRWQQEQIHNPDHYGVGDLIARSLLGHDAMVFGVIRNPWERMVTRFYAEIGTSWYKPGNRIDTQVPDQADVFGKLRDTFQDWVRVRAADHLADYGAREMFRAPGIAPRLARFEDLEEELRKAFGELAPPGPLKHQNRIRRRAEPAWSYYEEESAERIADLCRWEIDLYGYTLEEFPS